MHKFLVAVMCDMSVTWRWECVCHFKWGETFILYSYLLPWWQCCHGNASYHAVVKTKQYKSVTMIMLQECTTHVCMWYMLTGELSLMTFNNSVPIFDTMVCIWIRTSFQFFKNSYRECLFLLIEFNRNTNFIPLIIT